MSAPKVLKELNRQKNVQIYREFLSLEPLLKEGLLRPIKSTNKEPAENKYIAFYFSGERNRIYSQEFPRKLIVDGILSRTSSDEIPNSVNSSRNKSAANPWR